VIQSTVFNLCSDINNVLSNLEWKDDMKDWPPITKSSISEYLVTRKEVDGVNVDAQKSMLAYNYVDSGWVSYTDNKI